MEIFALVVVGTHRAFPVSGLNAAPVSVNGNAPAASETATEEGTEVINGVFPVSALAPFPADSRSRLEALGVTAETIRCVKRMSEVVEISALGDDHRHGKPIS